MGIMFASLSALSFAISSILLKKGMGDSKVKRNQAYFITVFSNTFFLTLVFLITFGIDGFKMSFSWIGLLFFILSGLLTTGFGRITFYQGIHRIGPSRAAAIKNGSPIFLLLYAVLVLGETITFGPFIGILLMITGIIMLGFVLVKQSGANGHLNLTEVGKLSFTTEMIGYILSIVSAVSFGIGQAIRKQGLALIDDVFFGACIGAATSLIFLLVYQSIKGELKTTLQGSFQTFQPYFWVAGIFTSVGPLFFFLGIMYTQVSYVGVIAASEPLLTVVFSALFMRKAERLSLIIWLIVSLVLAGAVVIAFSV